LRVTGATGLARYIEGILVSCKQNGATGLACHKEDILVSCRQNVPLVLHATKKKFCRDENKKALLFLPEYPMPALFPPWKKYSSGWLM
jgi:hypothetical protein